MGGGKTKIERYGLAEQVADLAEDHKSTRAISEILKARGYDVSHRAVHSFLSGKTEAGAERQLEKAARDAGFDGDPAKGVALAKAAETALAGTLDGFITPDVVDRFLLEKAQYGGGGGGAGAPISERYYENLWATGAIGTYGHGLIDRRIIVTPRMLRQFSRRDPIFNAIVNVRTEQVSRFCRIPRDRNERGYAIMQTNPDVILTDEGRAKVRAMEMWFGSTGFEKGSFDRGDLQQQLEMATRDHLELDANPFEIQYSERNEPYAFHYVDAATIIRAVEAGYDGDDAVRFIQIDPFANRIIERARFSERNMIYGFNNPRSDMEYRGYGYSCAEMILDQIITVIFALSYNKRTFQENRLPQGLIAVDGQVSDQTRAAFTRQVHANLTGMGWKVPILFFEGEGGRGGINFERWQLPNKDMEYIKFLQFLIGLECAVCKIDSQEIGFRIELGGSSPLIQSEATKTKIEYSMDRGLGGILEYLGKLMTQVLHRWSAWKDYRFEFVGLNIEDEGERIDRGRKRIDAGMTTLRETWEDEGKEVPDAVKDEPWWDYPLHPSVVQIIMSGKQMEAQAAMMGGPGAGGEPGAGGPEPAAEEYPDFTAMLAELGAGGGPAGETETENIEKSLGAPERVLEIVLNRTD